MDPLVPNRVLRRAVALARMSPQADANPRVGCVIVASDGRVLAEGHHRGAGTAHAEAAAIADAMARGVDLRGATAYVTLEPCAHAGRTPSCAHALVRAGISQVVLGQPDPNPVAAGGARILEAAGVGVRFDDELASSSERLNAEWTFSVTHARPFVRWKFAATLDGFSAAADGSSRWITGPTARADVHQWRARHGAVVVGTQTVLDDDPHLTVRDENDRPAQRQPLRVIVGRRELPKGARVFDAAAPSVHLRTHDVEAVLQAVRDRGVHGVWLEGGPALAAAFLEAGLIDEVVAYLAPALLGRGARASGDFGATSMPHLRRFDLIDVTPLASPAQGHGPAQTDVRLTMRPVTHSKEY